MITNRDIADSLYEIADYLELKGENPFRIRAYRNAGDTLLSHLEPVGSLSDEALLGIQGIGKDIAGKIRDFARRGEIELLTELRSEIPPELLDLKKIPGLGPKKVSLFYTKLGIDSFEKLKNAISLGTLLTLPGIKEKTVENILRGIEFYESERERLPLSEAYRIAGEIVGKIMESGLADRVEVAGSVRRMKETVGDIDILSTSGERRGLISFFTALPRVSEVLASGETKGSIRIRGAIQADLRVVEENSFGSALNYFTGSKAHNIKLRHIAKEMGMKLSEYGLTREKDRVVIAGREEGGIYRELGMDYIPPELREDSGEVEAALLGALPRLVTKDSIKGEVHLHTDWSDGHHSLEEVCSLMMKRGFKYIVITDHSKSLRVAGGLDERRVMEQVEAIEKINARLDNFRVFSGIEVDILKDGTLDLDHDILRGLDFVTGSIHSGLSQDRDRATGRIVAAMESGLVDMIGHLTGRMIGERAGYEVDREKILDAASANAVALELNSHPKRLDIDDLTCRMAKERGVKVAITTDMHHIDDIEYLHFGIGVARRGWLEEEDVINSWEGKRFISYIKKRRP